MAVEAGEGADVERVEVELLGVPGEGGVQGLAPGVLGLAVDAVDQVDVEHRDAGVADPAECRLDVGAALGAYGGAGLGLDEALHAEAEPGGSPGGQDGEAVGGGRGG